MTAVEPIVINLKGHWVGWPGDCFLDNEEFETIDDKTDGGLSNNQVEIRYSLFSRLLIDGEIGLQKFLVDRLYQCT